MMMLFFSRCLQTASVRVMPLGGEDRRSVPVSSDSDCSLFAADLGCPRVSRAVMVTSRV